MVVPSLQDNFPNTVLEALSCGTPTVGFAVGGIPDMIQQGETGLLLRPETPDELGSAVLHLLRDSAQLTRFRQQCRRTAVQQFSLAQQVHRYATLYGQLLNHSDR